MESIETPHMVFGGIEPDLTYWSVCQGEVFSLVNSRKIFFGKGRLDGLRVFHERAVDKHMLVHVATHGFVIMSIRTYLIDIEKGELVRAEDSHKIFLLRNRITGISVVIPSPTARCFSSRDANKHGGRNQDKEQNINQIHF